MADCLYFNATEYIKVVTVQKMQTLLQVLPLPSSKDSYFQNEAECKTLIACENEFYLQENKKIIFMLLASHLALLWNRGWEPLGNGLRMTRPSITLQQVFRDPGFVLFEGRDSGF